MRVKFDDWKPITWPSGLALPREGDYIGRGTPQGVHRIRAVLFQPYQTGRAYGDYLAKEDGFHVHIFTCAIAAHEVFDKVKIFPPPPFQRNNS